MKKKHILFILKLLLTAGVLYFVFNKIDLRQCWLIIKDTKPLYFLFALCFYLLSQLVSSVRLLTYYKAAGVNISKILNFKLYTVGMFYNLFLPGGIGGDGYKVFLLKKYDETLKTKALIHASILDRFSGLSALCFFIIVLTLASSFAHIFNVPHYWLYLLLALVIPVSYFFIKLFFRPFASVFMLAFVQSVLIQALQLVAAVFLLGSLSLWSSWQAVIDYLCLFLASSLALIFPFFHGGIGAREYVFLEGSKLLAFKPELGLAFSSSFFIVNLLASSLGVFFLYRIKRLVISG